MSSRMSIILSAVIVAVLAWAAPTSADPIAGNPVAGGDQTSSVSRPGAGARPVLADCPRVSDSYDIGPGATGGNVREVQCLLNRTLSWQAFPFTIEIDGEYGPITTAAVWEFQECVNHRGTPIGVDGRVGRQTLPHLRWWGNIHTPSTGERIC
jgi:peptidoglycan hydrolase-like protein with peptidoglycan-binding domain